MNLNHPGGPPAARRPRPNRADPPDVADRSFGGRAPRTRTCPGLAYVRAGSRRRHACLLVDLCNRETAGRAASDRKGARLAKSAFAAVPFPPFDIEAFRTDRGPELGSAEIGELLEALGIGRPLSRRGRPCDNAVDEPTGKILKAELVWRERFGTLSELREKLAGCVWRCNNVRLHSKLGYMSPVEFGEAGLGL